VSSDQENWLNAVLDRLEKGHITTAQAAARIDPENRQVMCFACKFRLQRVYGARHQAGAQAGRTGQWSCGAGRCVSSGDWVHLTGAGIRP
jgi:hypothetical protein